MTNRFAPSLIVLGVVISWLFVFTSGCETNDYDTSENIDSTEDLVSKMEDLEEKGADFVSLNVCEPQ
jgi:tRNA A37 methylthiotransferase MiaB